MKRKEDRLHLDPTGFYPNENHNERISISVAIAAVFFRFIFVVVLIVFVVVFIVVVVFIKIMIIRKNVKMDKAAAAFRAIDTDHSGFLDREEFLKFTRWH